MSFKKTMVGAFIGISLIAAPLAASIPANAVVSAPTSVSDLVKDDNFQEIQEVFNAINVFRASKNLPPVTYNVYAASVAQDWSDYMGAEADFSHNPNFYTDPRVSGHQYAGEIIAARWDRSGQALVNQWINSPGHNAIMSDPNFTTIGIGITYTNETGKTFEETGRLATYGNVDFYRFVPNKDKTYANPLDAKNNVNPLPTTTAPEPLPPTPTPTPPPVEPTPAPTPTTPPLVHSPELVVPQTPIFDNSEQAYTLPSQTGIIYSVNGVEQRAGKHNTRETSIKITVKAISGYAIDGLSEWSYKYTPTYSIPRMPDSYNPVRFRDIKEISPLTNETTMAAQSKTSINESAGNRQVSIFDFLSPSSDSAIVIAPSVGAESKPQISEEHAGISESKTDESTLEDAIYEGIIAGLKS